MGTIKLSWRLAGLTIGQRLAVGFFATLLFTAFLGYVCVDRIARVGQQTVSLYEHPFAVTNAAREATINMLMVRLWTLKALSSASKEDSDHNWQESTNFVAAVDRTFDLMRERILGDPAEIDTARRDFNDYLRLRSDVLALANGGKAQQALALANGPAAAQFEIVLADVKKVREWAGRSALLFMDDTDQVQQTTEKLVFAMIASAILSVAAIGFIVTRSITVPLAGLNLCIKRLSVGDTASEIHDLDRQDEIGEMARSVRALQDNARDQALQNWIKGEVHSTISDLQAVEDFEGFVGELMQHLNRTFPLLYGSFFVADQTRTRYERVGGFALSHTISPRIFARGDGLIGQAAANLKPIFLPVVPSDMIRVSAGLGTVTPRTLAIMPLVDQGHAVAVLELAPIEPLRERDLALLDALLPTLALKVLILASNQETKKALTRQQAILNASLHGIAVFRDRKFLLCNPAMERMFGYGAGEMVGLSSRVIYPSDEDFIALGQRLYPAIARGDSFDEEIPAMRRDGSTFWARLSINALDGGDPEQGIVAIFEDVTERRQARPLSASAAFAQT